MAGANPSPHSVVHVIGQLNVGGAEKMLLNLCRAMPSAEFRQTVVAMAGQPGSLSEEYRASNVTEVPCRLSPSPVFAWRFVNVLRGAEADVLVSHISLASASILLLGALARIPKRIAVFHSDGDGRPTSLPRKLYRRIMRALLAHVATDVVGVTSSTLAFSGVTGPHATVIPNGVDLSQHVPGDRDGATRGIGIGRHDRIIAHIGRAAPEKNRKLLPAIMRKLPSTYWLGLAGADEISDLELAACDPLDSRVINLGILADVRPLLAAADVLVLPSIREGLPLVILEALAMGCPVVATDLPGIRSIAGHIRDLRLVANPLDAQGFASAIEWTLTNKSTPEEMRRQLSEARLDLGSVADRWVRLCGATP